MPHDHSNKGFLHHFPLAAFKPIGITAFKHYDKRHLTRDIAAGITVGMVALPLSMAFAIASGVGPAAGLYTAIIGGLLISLFGGCKVQIGGPAGAFIVIIYGLIAQYGLPNLMLATIFSGIMLFVLGLLKLGSLVRFIPVGIVIGFTNGIAISIAVGQLKDFMGLSVAKMPADFIHQTMTIWQHLNTFNISAFAVAAVSLAILFLWPKSYSVRTAAWKRWLAKVPATIIVLVLSTCVVTFGHLPVETIGSKFGGIPQTLPSFAIPEFSWEAAKRLFTASLTLAVLGSIESLLCARVSDAMTDDRHDPNQELMGQGIANFVVPFFGGIPATGTVARTVTNIKSGAVSPIAGVVHAVTLLVVILAAAPLAANIPLAALSAILMNVAWNMGNWREFGRLPKFTMSYKMTLLSTFFLTVIFDLSVAVEVGLAVAAIFFLYRMNTLATISRESLPEDIQDKAECWRLHGALFFGSVSKMEHMTDPMRMLEENAPKVVMLDVRDLLSMDNSALDVIEGFERSLSRHGGTMMVVGANGHPLRLLQRSGFLEKLGPNAVQTMEEAAERARTLLSAKKPLDYSEIRID